MDDEMDDDDVLDKIAGEIDREMSAPTFLLNHLCAFSIACTEPSHPATLAINA